MYFSLLIRLNCLIYLCYTVLQLAIVPNCEILDLQDLFTSTQGSFWTWHGEGSIWNFFAPNPCADHRQGITCGPAAGNDTNSNFTIVDLKQYSMSGTIPASISNLTALQTLDVAGNYINGTLPDAIGDLPQLQLLSVADNLLTGSTRANNQAADASVHICG